MGAHNYVVGNLPWGMKAAVSMVGLGGNKDKGMKYLRECAEGNGETSVDAQILLVLFLAARAPLRRGIADRSRPDPAFSTEFPAGDGRRESAAAAGRYQEAAAVYRRILAGWKGRPLSKRCIMRR